MSLGGILMLAAGGVIVFGAVTGRLAAMLAALVNRSWLTSTASGSAGPVTYYTSPGGQKVPSNAEVSPA